MIESVQIVSSITCYLRTKNGHCLHSSESHKTKKTIPCSSKGVEEIESTRIKTDTNN